MLGTIINTAAVIICAVIGTLFKGGIPDRFNDTIMKALGLAVLLIGLSQAFEVRHMLLLIFSMVFGSIIGELLDIDKNLEKLGLWIERKVGAGEGTFAKGFVTASLIFCIGSMAIVGSLQSGLTGNHEMLKAKSVLDGFASIILASTMGIGVAFSGVAIFLYQGAITLGATFLKDFLNEEIIREVSAVGGLLISAIGLNFFDIKRIKVANMLPALFIPFIYFIVFVPFLDFINRNFF
ncbi:MAG: DUF554 domain-containing protein [Clostridiales bacterium]|nr:DUF554 domain-containing protein [Clostridiales bacterium]